MSHDNEELFKEKLILEKVYGKSFTTVLDEVHFVSPTPGPPGKPFFPQGMSFAPSQAEQLPKHLPLFLLTSLFWKYLNSQARINKTVNKSIPKDTCFHISIISLGLYLSLQNASWIFSRSFIFDHVWENFQIDGVHIPKKCIVLRHFYSCLSPLKTRPKFLPSHPRQKETTHSPRKHSFENRFPQQ